MELLRDFKNISKSDMTLAGGKGASLGEMTQAGISVPSGFVILASAFEKFLEETDLNVEIDSILDSVNHKEIHTVEYASEKIEALILGAVMPKDIKDDIQKFFKNLDSQYAAVRSSATAEDSASAAWAGQLESYLNTTEETLLENVKKCWASLFTPRAIFYRFEKGLHKQQISVAVVVQKMVESEKSGIAFSVHPVTEDKNQLIIEAGLGFGEAIVSGQITPDSYVVEKQPRRIIDKNIQTQSRGLYRAKNGGNEWRDITKEQGEKQVLSDSEILELSEVILRIENHYSFPCDIEWAAGKGKFYIVQSRPITTLANQRGAKDFKKIINLKEWEFEFQQRNEHPILMADFWCRALYQKYVDEIDLQVEPYDYLFTDSSKGYVKTSQKKITLEKLKKAFDEDGTYPEYLYSQTIKRVNELNAVAILILEELKSEVSNKKLVGLWKKFDEVFLTLIPWYWIPYYPIEQNLLSDKVSNGLTKYRDEIEKITDFNNALILSVSSTNELAFIEEQKDFFVLVKMAIGDDDFSKNKIFNEKARTYLKKYSWMNTFILLPIEPLSLNKLLEKIKNAIKEKSIETYSLQQQQKSKNNEVLKEILHIVRKDKELLSAIENTKKIGWVLTWSVETSLHTLSGLQSFFKLIAKHLEIPYSQWIYFTSNEIVQVLSGKNSVKELALEEREKGYFFVMEKGIQKMITGEEGKSLSEWVDKNLNKVEENITEFKGQSASPGHATGKVRIALLAKDSHNLKDDEVLVCAMTSPDYVPAMKRASAIITDEGGLLCHAAIMSREFGKPCVIATKIATRVLKDGDMVEVDADSGIIKILKK